MKQYYLMKWCPFVKDLQKCLKEVLGLVDETVRFYDEWSSVVHNFVNSEGTLPTSFVGHCCEHQWLKKDFQSKNPLPSTKQQLDQAKTPTKRQHRMCSPLQLPQLQQEPPQQLEYENPLPSTKQQLDQAKTPTKRQHRMCSPLQLPQLQQEPPQQLEYGNKNESTSIDGYMYLPELRLFIDNPKDMADVHALAGMNNAYKALWHCVPSESTVLLAKMMNLHPQ